MTAESTALTPASLAFADFFVAEDTATQQAREAGINTGAPVVTPGVGATLRFLAAALKAEAVVEVGTGTGVATLYLLDGLVEGGIVTSIEQEVDQQSLAKDAISGSSAPNSAARLIAGRPLDVLPRLTDAGYDLLVVNADPSEYPAYFEQAQRLLRPGGVLAFHHALLGGKIADPAQRDEVTVKLRDLQKEILEHERLTPLLLPVGDGLLLAVAD